MILNDAMHHLATDMIVELLSMILYDIMHYLTTLVARYMNSSSVLSSISMILVLFAGKIFFAVVFTVFADVSFGEFLLFIESEALPVSE